MPLVSEARLLQIFKNNPSGLLRLPCAGMYIPGGLRAQLDAATLAKTPLTPDLVKAVLAIQRNAFAVQRAQMGKHGRPWDIDTDMFTRMDRKQPWWGWEFEVGYKSATAYEEGVGYAFDTFDGAMFDSEGEGRYPVEITFPPQEMPAYLDGSAQACQFMKWTSDNADRLYTNTGQNNVGTHLNMSDPRFHKSQAKAGAVARFLNRTLQQTLAVNGQRKKMFGRESIYAGFFLNSAQGEHWTEFKGFRTTYDYDTWLDYVKTAAGLQKCIDAYFELEKAGPVQQYLGVQNLYDVVFNDARPIIGDYRDAPRADGHAPLCTRFGGSYETVGQAHV